MAKVVTCDSCGEQITPKPSDPQSHAVHIKGKSIDRTYDLCDVCRPQFLRLIRQLTDFNNHQHGANLRTHSVTLATKTKAEAVNVG